MPGAGRRVPNDARSGGPGVAGLGIIALSFLPLVVHELTNDFSEVQAALDYLRGGGQPAANGPLVSFLVIAARVLSWPLTGLLTEAGWVALVAVAVVIAITIWTGRVGTLRERQAARWLGLGLLWTAFALTFLSPSLATDRARPAERPLPRVRRPDGLHPARHGRGRAVAAGACRRPDPAPPSRSMAAVARRSSRSGLERRPSAAGRAPRRWLPGRRRRGGADHGVAGGEPITLVSLPGFKSTEAYGYPLVRAGAEVRTATGGDPDAVFDGALVVICDSRFEVAIGAPAAGRPRRPSRRPIGSASPWTGSWPPPAGRSRCTGRVRWLGCSPSR